MYKIERREGGGRGDNKGLEDNNLGSKSRIGRYNFRRQEQVWKMLFQEATAIVGLRAIILIGKIRIENPYRRQEQDWEISFQEARGRFRRYHFRRQGPMIGLGNITLVMQKQVWDISFWEATVRLEFHKLKGQ